MKTVLFVVLLGICNGLIYADDKENDWNSITCGQASAYVVSRLMGVSKNDKALAPANLFRSKLSSFGELKEFFKSEGLSAVGYSCDASILNRLGAPLIIQVQHSDSSSTYLHFATIIAFDKHMGCKIVDLLINSRESIWVTEEELKMAYLGNALKVTK